MQIIIAALQILNLDMEAFNRKIASANGIVHHENNTLSGEAWDRGSVILSWDDIEHESYNLLPGHNIIIHEFAHKLDMLNGRANGMPPLHPNMSIKQWSQVLSQAYDLLNNNLDNFQHSYVNPYASTNPAEFFAVISE